MRSSAALVLAVALTASTAGAVPVKNSGPKGLKLTTLTTRTSQYTYIDSREVRLALRSPTEARRLGLSKRDCDAPPEPRPQNPDGGDDKPKDDKPPTGGNTGKTKQIPNPFPEDDGGPVVKPKEGGEPSGQPSGNDQDKPQEPEQQPQEPQEEPQGGPQPEPAPQEPQGEPQQEPRPSGDGGSSNPNADAYVKPHNDARARYNAKPVGWDDNLAAIALKWVKGCDFKHSGGSLADFKYGENLAAGTGDYQIPDAVDGWVSEEKDYDPSNPEKGGTGHFTQVVWKETTTIGCAFFDCPAGTGPFGGGSPWRYHSCVYTPPGNWIGEYNKNVG